jgi:hypothetical protein
MMRRICDFQKGYNKKDTIIKTKQDFVARVPYIDE